MASIDSCPVYKGLKVYQIDAQVLSHSLIRWYPSLICLFRTARFACAINCTLEIMRNRFVHELDALISYSFKPRCRGSSHKHPLYCTFNYLVDRWIMFRFSFSQNAEGFAGNDCGKSCHVHEVVTVFAFMNHTNISKVMNFLIQHLL